MRKTSGNRKKPRSKAKLKKSLGRSFRRIAPSSPRPVPLEGVLPQEQKILTELPFSYGKTQLVLLVRDPYWAFSYWDFSGEAWNGAQRKLSEDPPLKPMIRIHDLDAKRSSTLLISLEARNWYLHLGTPDHRYAAELGLGDGRERFYLIARSNEVRTPRDSPSEVVDSDWSDRDFEEIYRLSGGGQSGLSSPGSLFFPRQA